MVLWMWSRYFTGTGNQEVLKVQAVSGSNAVAVTGKANNQIIVEGSAGLSTETVTHVSGADHLFVIFLTLMESSCGANRLREIHRAKVKRFE